MNFVAVAIVSAISWPPVQQKSRLLIGLNCILLCLNNSSQIAKKALCYYEENNDVWLAMLGSFARPLHIHRTKEIKNTVNQSNE